MDDWPAFRVLVRTLSGVTVVELSGELDLFAGARFSARLDVLAHTGVPDLVLDLRPVTFMDCSGLSLLCRLRNRILERGGRLRLVIDNPRLLRLLRTVQLADAFEIVDDLAPALGRPEQSPADRSDEAYA